MLDQLSERIYVATGGVNIGVVTVGEDGAILIDSGLNDTAARKVLRALSTDGRSVKAIVTTHGHADHFGGNAFVVKRTGARVWAPVWDEVMLRYPIMQPSMLFAGADPPPSMRGGFLLAEPSPVDQLYDVGDFIVDGVGFEAVSLAGHSPNQMGLICDDVFFAADVALPMRVLERYKMPYLYSVREHLQALETASYVTYQTAVPGHGEPCSDLATLIQANKQVVEEVARHIVDICAQPAMPGDILAQLLDHLDVQPEDPAAYYLLHPTIFAFLSYLEEQGLLEHRIEKARSIWVAR